MMRPTRFSAIGTFVVCFFVHPAAERLVAQSKAKAENVPEITYDSVPNFLKLPPNLHMGEGIGVATNSKGHVFVLYGFAFAHAVRVDSQDNIWCVDEGSNMIIKFNPSGRVVMVLGRRPEAVEELSAQTGMPGQGVYSGANKPYSFNRLTDVAWDAAGNIFVSDGYGDSRVVKYDKNCGSSSLRLQS